MYKYFADWYQPTHFGEDRKAIELRWQGIESVLEYVQESGDNLMIQELTRVVFGYPQKAEGFLDEFRNFFKKFDPTFKSSNNEREIEILAGCVLGVLCDFEEYDIPEAPLSILTTSFFNSRVPKVENGLITMADAWINEKGINSRERSDAANSKLSFDNEKISEAIEACKDTNDISIPLKMLLNIMGKTVSSIQSMRKTLKIQDEEIHMLWWMISEWSTLWKCRFDEIEIEARPIMLAKEAACISDELLEPPSIKAIFQRIGIDDKEELSIPMAINKCGINNLKTLKPKNEPCSIIFPVHFAISRAIETDADSSWISAWHKKTRIDKKTILPYHIAIQLFREHKLMKIVETENE